MVSRRCEMGNPSLGQKQNSEPRIPIVGMALGTKEGVSMCQSSTRAQGHTDVPVVMSLMVGMTLSTIRHGKIAFVQALRGEETFAGSCRR